MNARFEQGGDKYDSIKADEQWERATVPFTCEGCGKTIQVTPAMFERFYMDEALCMTCR